MPTEALFRPLANGAVMVTIEFNGQPLRVPSGRSVAAALLASGVTPLRTTPVSGAPRAPYCMMGVCFECLVTIDGVGNRQGCLIAVAEGMRVETQRGKREVGR